MIWWYRLIRWFRDWTPPSQTRVMRAEYATARHALKGFEEGLRTDRDWMQHWIMGKFFRNIEPPREFVDKVWATHNVYLDGGGVISMVRKRQPKIKSHG